jgi:hypothetical protein
MKRTLVKRETVETSTCAPQINGPREQIPGLKALQSLNILRLRSTSVNSDFFVSAGT